MYPATCPQQTPVAIPVMLLGNAGTCTNSRIKGHARMGGNRVPAEQALHTIVAVAPEHMSSQLCPYCRWKMEHPTTMKIKDGKPKFVKNNGVVVCVNKDCVSFQVGYSVRGRDENACVKSR